MKILLLTFTSLLFFTSCNDLDGSSVNQDSFEITILKPAGDGSSLGKDTVIAGDCGYKNYPIEISGDVSLYSICQSDYTWSAPISGNGFTQGQTVTVNVALKSPDYSQSSPTVTRTFIKADLACDDATNLTKIFANIDDGANGTTIPYKICTSSQLANISMYPDKKFQLGKNIDFGFASFNPIPVAFSGELDGDDFVLSNISINRPSETAIGIFKVISGGTVKNLKIKDANITGNIRAGILAGDWRGTGVIQNVDVTGSVNAVQMAGGLIGLANSNSALTMIDIKLDVDVTANDYAGGLISYIYANNTAFALQNSNIYANVTGNKYVGGVVGRMWKSNASFNNVLHKGDINSVDTFVGGLIGEAYHGVNIDNSKHIGSITVPRNSVNADMNVGGLVGVTRGTTNISNSHVVSNITMGGDYAGGLVGRFFGGSISDSYSRGNLIAVDNYYNAITKFVGGLTGNVNTNSTITNAYSLMNITSNAEYAGGLVGFLGGDSSSISDSYAKGNLSARKNFVGGLVGKFNGASLTNSFSEMNLSITNPTPLSYIGGIVGHVYNTATFDTLYHRGDISITGGTADYVGGAFGYVKANSLNKVFTSGSITGVRSNVGGIAGYLRAPLTSAMSNMTITASLKNIGGIAGIGLKENISNTFFTGSLTGDGNIGGIVGWYIPNTTTVSHSYALGSIYKLAGSSSSDSVFGAVVGSGIASDVNESYYLDTINLYDLGTAAAIASPNSFGTAKNSSELLTSSSYVGFDFASNWKMPSVAFILPGEVSNYSNAVISWMDDVNYGFQAVQVYSDDPISESDPVIIPNIYSNDSLALEFGQDLVDAITSTAPVTNVNSGSLEISIENPAQNNENIYGRMLVYGECGVAGNAVQVSGAFDVWTICQSNQRWAAVIDSTDLNAGNLTLSVDLKNATLGAGSAVVSKTVVKSASLCDQPANQISEFGNTNSGGNGAGVPYIICNRGQLANISNHADKNFELGANISFSGATINPIAVDFTGSIDGKNYKLKNITINKSTTTGVGIFKSIGDGAVVKNLSLLDFNISGYSQVGALAGSWKGAGTLQNITASGTVNGILYTGGLVGLGNTSSDLDLSDITTTISVTGNDYTGGVIAYINTNDGAFNATNINLTNSVVSNGANGNVGAFIGAISEPNTTINTITQTGDVSSLGLNVGGLIGLMSGGSLSSCSINGDITVTRDGTAGFIAGVVGKTTGSSTISNCVYNGNIDAGSDHVAGIVGYLQEGSLENVSSSGSINVDDQKYNVPRSFVGGVLGLSGEDLITNVNNASSSMNITAKALYVGGIIGAINDEGSTLRNSHATGDIAAQVQFVGGLVGFFMGDILEDSHATGNISVTKPTPFAYIGGLVGYANSWNSDYKNLFATGNIEVNGGTADYVGGLVGFFRGGALERSYARGNLSGDAIRNSAGGLIGIMRGSVDASYATGNVSCKGGNCGGLLGYLLNSNVTNSFSIGNVEAVNGAGGLIGYVNISNGSVVEDNYSYGVVSRKSGSSTDILKFGPLISGEENLNSFDISQNFYINEKRDITHNNLGIGLANAISNIAANYTSFAYDSFTDDWMSAPSGFELYPGFAYNLPVPDWVAGGGGGSALFSVSGTLSGLEHDTLKITLNGGEELTLNPGDTSFTFFTQIVDGNPYLVAISKQPEGPNLNCVIANESGNAIADVTNISLSCPTVTGIDLVAVNNMAVGSSQNLVVNGTLSDASSVDLTNFSTFSQTPAGTFALSGNVLTASNGGSATVTAEYLSLTSSESISASTLPTQLAITINPTNSIAGSNISSIQVELQDAGGNVVTTATNNITLSFANDASSGTASLGGTLSKNATNGVAVFDNITLDKAFNGYSLRAQSSGLTQAISSSFDIGPGSKSSMAFSIQPLGESSNVVFAPFSVEVLDAYGNRVESNESVLITLGNDPSSGVGAVSGTLTKTTTNGVATFDDVSIDFATAGYTFNAQVASLSNVSSSSFNIFAVATKLVHLSQPSNTIESGVIPSFQVALTDDFNTVITNSTSSITIELLNDPTSGSAGLNGVLTKNAVNGVVTFNDLSIDTAAANFSFRSTSSGLTEVASNSFNIILPAPTSLSLISPTSSPSSDSTPTIQVSGVANGDIVALYKNNGCTGTAVASYVAVSSSVDMTTSVLDEGSYTFYADRTNSQGLKSSCSTLSIAYEVQAPFGQLDELNSFGNWSNSAADNRDWTINTGETGSAGVGPTSGTYAYTEASNPVVAGDVFILESNVLDGSSNDLNFSFDWNKRGDSMGDLFLEASNNGGSSWSEVWSHLGADVATNGVDVWRSQNIDLCNLGYVSANTQLRFRAVMPTTGNIWNSDIAVDNLNFTDAGCSSTSSSATVTFDTPLEGVTIGIANQSSFDISGTCSDDGQNVIVSGDASASSTCNAGAWSFNLDLSTVGDGLVNLNITHLSGSGGANGSVARQFMKDATTIQYDSLDTLGNWINATGDDRDWTINTGGTPSTGIGPTGGVNSSSYIYTEASNPVAAGDVFILESNVLDGAANNLRISFDWNKRGSSMGDLFLEYSTDGGVNWNGSSLWSHLGVDIATNGVDVWNNESVDLCSAGLNTSNLKFRFRAVMPSSGTVWNSDIALDELKFTADGCGTGTPAAIALSSPSSSTLITAINQSSFTVGGTCSDHGQNITFLGDVAGTTTCNLGNWSYTFDLSSNPDGPLVIIADHTSADGGPKGRDTVTFTKDTSSATIQQDDFNSFINWANVGGDQRDWSINSGETPSVGIGPSSGFGGSGSYVYTEASNPVAAGDTFLLESNTLSAGTYNLNMTFKWNKRGTSMGDLFLEISNNNGASWTSIWSHLGADVATNGSDVWNTQDVDVCNLGYNSGNVKFRFRAVMPTSGTVWNSDIALDKIELKANGCQ